MWRCCSNASHPFPNTFTAHVRPPPHWRPDVSAVLHTSRENRLCMKSFLPKDPTRKHSPPQVPDVSAVLHTSDFPCLKANRSVPDIEFRQDDSVVRALDLIDDPSGSN